MDPINSIPTFFANKSIFVTGATGFMGKVLIEKLLWSCPDLDVIFLLIRPKKNMGTDERLKKILNLPLFNKLWEKNPDAFKKLIPIKGNTCVPDLGISSIDRQILIEKVSIVFHVAASVRFDDPLKSSIFANTRSTKDVCVLATNMKNLVAFMHVSTTYSQADKYYVEEKLYPTDIDWKKTICITENLDNCILRTLTPKIIDNFPNTYTFAKRLAEDVVEEYVGILPIIVYRPSIVISSVEEPVIGWIDNFNGPVGMMVGTAKGILRVIYLDPKTNADFIPVDVAIRLMITATWKRGIVPINRDLTVHVYNGSSSEVRSLSAFGIMNIGLNLIEEVPLSNVLWRPQIYTTNNSFIFYILTICLHLLPSVLIDLVLKSTGRKPILIKLQKKIYAANNGLLYFLNNEWKFKNEKFLKLLTDIPSSDINAFGFDYGSFSVDTYFKNCIIGAKKYLLNEKMEELDQAKIHYNRMYWVDIFFKIGLSILVIWFIYYFNVLSSITDYLLSLIILF